MGLFDGMGMQKPDWLSGMQSGLNMPMAQAGLSLMSGHPMGAAMQRQRMLPQQGPGLLGLLASQTTPGTPDNGGWQTTTTPTLGGLFGGRGFFGG